MQSTFGLDQETIQLITQVLSNFPDIQGVRVYGSRAMGNYKKTSDIDLAVYGLIAPEVLRELAGQLDELPLPYMFDVTDYNKIENEAFKQHIDQHSLPFLSSP